MNKYRCSYSMWQMTKPITGDVEVIAEDEIKARQAAKDYLWKHHYAIEFSSQTVTILEVHLLEENVTG